MTENVNCVENYEVSAGEDLNDVENIDDEEGFEDLWFGEGFPRGFTVVNSFFF